MKKISEKKIKDAITEFLSSFSFFDGLSSDELGVISEYIQFFEMDPDENLFKEGDEGDSVFFIIEGEAEVIKETLNQGKIGIDKVVISTLTKGRSIGEMAVIDKIPRSASVKSRTHITLASMTREGFYMILEEYPKIGNKILIGITRLLSVNLRKTSSRLADYMLPVS